MVRGGSSVAMGSRRSVMADNLAVMEVEGIDYDAVTVGATFRLGWVQDLVLP